MRSFLAGSLLALALFAAGCGGGGSPSTSSGNGEASKSAAQVVADAAKAAAAASSMHITGQITAQGQQISLDLTAEKGTGATGWLTLKGQKVDLEVIGGDAYMKAPAAFWTKYAGPQGSMIAQLLADKWLKFPTSDPRFGAFAKLANSRLLIHEILSKHGVLTNKGATTYKGQSVVAIDDTTKGGTLYVAGTGTAYPVAITKTGSGAAGSITFGDWNKSVSLTAPSGAIDVSQLAG